MRNVAVSIVLAGVCVAAQVAVAGNANADFAGSAGAVMPFVTVEAETDAPECVGKTVLKAMPPKGGHPTPESEASGYGYVELGDTSDYLEMRITKEANAMVIRACIPDAPQGGGMEATLGLYVNGARRQDVCLSSKYSWLYGSGKRGENGQSDTPTEFPHVFWDEARIFITDGVKPGDRLRLQKDAQDSACFYRIDLVDLELAPEPLPRPENSLSVADYGAKGESAETDTVAIQQCVTEAKAQEKTVWLPPGTFLLHKGVTVDGVRIQGSGIWHTRVFFTTLPDKWTGIFGLNGEGASVSDLLVESVLTRRGFPLQAFTGAGRGWSVENVWITHTNTAFWIGGSDGLVANCRVRLTYADGININNGKQGAVSRIIVENNHIRGTGDDSLAILSHIHKEDTLSTDEVTFRHNTAVAPWWASCCDLAGGKGHVIEDNFFEGTGLVVNLPASYPMLPQGPSVIRRNVLMRCGSDYADQRRGAIWIYPGSTSIDGLLIENNRIVRPLFVGIDLQGSCEQRTCFSRNLIDSPTEAAVRIGRDAKGVGVFTGNMLVGNNSRSWIADHSQGAYHVTESENSH